MLQVTVERGSDWPAFIHNEVHAEVMGSIFDSVEDRFFVTTTNLVGYESNCYLFMIHLNIEIEKGESLALSTDKEMNTLIYSLDGELEVNDQRVLDKEMVIFNRDGDEINIKASKTTRFIVLSGQAINEEVVANGPFVMNSHVEIMEAMRDTKMGKMGILIENFD